MIGWHPRGLKCWPTDKGVQHVDRRRASRSEGSAKPGPTHDAIEDVLDRLETGDKGVRDVLSIDSS